MKTSPNKSPIIIFDIPEKDQPHIIPALRNTTIVFEHPALSFQIHPRFKKYFCRITDRRLSNKKEWKNPEAFFSIFLENIKKVSPKKGVILMKYNPAIALCIGKLYPLYNSIEFAALTCFAFCHTDEDTKTYQPENFEEITAAKAEYFISLMDFPFIKKYEIPYNFELTMPFIAHISLEAHGWKPPSSKKPVTSYGFLA
jgi:hypothetical protein